LLKSPEPFQLLVVRFYSHEKILRNDDT